MAGYEFGNVTITTQQWNSTQASWLRKYLNDRSYHSSRDCTCECKSNDKPANEAIGDQVPKMSESAMKKCM
jgi:hypothetical protein